MAETVVNNGPQEPPEAGNIVPNLSRLPRDVTPKRYELKLDVRPEQYIYDGTVNIRIYFHAVVDTVWLHCSRLDIKEASLQFSPFALPLKASDIIEVSEKGCVGLRFKGATVCNGSRAWLSIKFCGRISKNLEGFFSNPFVERETGETRVGAATMFAATEARSCFPCFDEPDLKAVFAIETTVDEDLMVISNMPVMDSKWKPGGGKYRKRRRTDYFHWTKSMSTYLVCLVIGQYDYVETHVNRQSRFGTRLRVYTPCGQRENGRFALQVAKKCLIYFNSYFGKKFPLPKLDLVSLSKLSVGAMENWGLITCRETGLIADLHDANPLNLQKIATLIAHEISHQWFGNLVTMKWWDNLYLNEGFATFMQYLCIDAIHPEYKIFNQFCSDTLVPALGMDALEHSHPIEMPLHHASDISQVFDKITYCKGAAVINMLHKYIGEEKFKIGLQNYMDFFAYGNATTEDLWRFFSDSSRIDVASLMNNWIRELGFPVLRVTYAKTVSDDGICTAILKFKQERFSNSAASSRYNGMWTVPIQGIYVKNGIHVKKFDYVLDKEYGQVELQGLDLSDPDSWVKINPGLVGFYRVLYCENSYKNLFRNLDNPNLTAVDRMGLFDDQVATVLCEESGETVRILKLAQTFKEYETSITVWRSVVGVLHHIRTLTWHCQELADSYDKFCLAIFKPLFSKLKPLMDTPPESNVEGYQCMVLLFWHSAIHGDEETRSLALEMFSNHLEGVRKLPSSMRDGVYRAVMTCANQSTLDQLKNIYLSTDSAEERNRILMAFGCSENPDILDQILSFSMSDSILPQESIVSIVSVASNRMGARQAWAFFTRNIDRIVQRYSGGLFLMSRLIKAVTESFADLENYQEIASFFGRHERKLIGAEKAIKQALEHVRLNVTWRDKHIDSIRNFLEKWKDF